MGKLVHRWVHSIMPSWLITGFKWTNTSRKKLLHLRPKLGIHCISSKSAAPPLPYSASSNTESANLLTEIDHSVYYYSQSDNEQEQPITGNSKPIPSPSTESTHHEGGDDCIYARMGICALAASSIVKGMRPEDKFEPSSPDREIEYPTSLESVDLQGHRDTDVHLQNHQQEECLDHPYPIQHHIREPTRPSKEIGVMKGNHHNWHCGHHIRHHRHHHRALHDESHRQHLVAEGRAHADQHCQHHSDNEPHGKQQFAHFAGDVSFRQRDGPHAHHYRQNNHFMFHAGHRILCHNNDDVCNYAHHYPNDNQVHESNHDANGGSLCMHEDDVYNHAHHYDHKNHASENHHNCQTCGSSNILCNSKESRIEPRKESHPLPSLAKSANTEIQHSNDSNHQDHNRCQNDHHYYQLDASSIDYHQSHRPGFKRKSIPCLDGVDGKEDCKNEDDHQCSINAWSCVKRQRTHEGDDAACELPECISEKVGDGCAVVQYSYRDPQFAFWESMMQMIVSNELWNRSELKFLLYCYLALNDPHLHHTIHTSFLQVLSDLRQSSLL